MGPITLFDKSFLQSLNVDESVWFDHFFLTNVCPIFYVETLADLSKVVREGRKPEEEVAYIANKFPEMHGSPNAHHTNLCISNLMGHSVPMTTGQIPLSGGRLVKSGGKSGVVYEQSPESEAFSRWHKQQFLEIERLYAHGWREALQTLDLKELASNFRTLGVDGRSCKTLEEAKALAVSIVSGRDKPFDRMKLAILFLHIPRELHREILERWSIVNYPPLIEYAPYVAHVLTIELFFQIALAANLISSERPSNRTDIAYLFYLPFCMAFLSSDKLHRRCAPLFLRHDQQFIWGPELKDDLTKINSLYLSLSEAERERGVMSFAGYPPKEGDFLVSRIWDRHFQNWRGRKHVDISETKIDNSKLVEEINKMKVAPALLPEEVDFDPSSPESVTLQRVVRRKKGSWYQVPKDLKDTDDHK